MKFKHLWFLSFFLLFLGCKDSGKVSDEKLKPSTDMKTSNSTETFVYKSMELTGAATELQGIWILQTFNKETIKNTSSYINPTIEINPKEGKVLGNAGCNKYSGKIIFMKEKQIGIEQLETTKVPCPGSDLEEQYLAAITKKALTYVIKDKQLIFYNEETTLVFEKSN